MNKQQQFKLTIIIYYLIIDVTYGLTEENYPNQLWINPNNYLIVAKNIKNNLQEYLKNKYIIEDIDSKYADFEERISIIDARLHSLSKDDIEAVVGDKIAENIIKARSGKMRILEGGGGVYGKVE